MRFKAQDILYEPTLGREFIVTRESKGDEYRLIDFDGKDYRASRWVVDTTWRLAYPGREYR